MIDRLKLDHLPKIEVLMPNGKIMKGFSEPSIKKLKENEIVQFARFGFCRLDDKEKSRFWFTHE